MIYLAYNRGSYEVTEIGNLQRVALNVDLEQLYTDHVGYEVNSQTFANLEVAAHG